MAEVQGDVDLSKYDPIQVRGWRACVKMYGYMAVLTRGAARADGGDVYPRGRER
jgi:hypothetical protein